MNDHTRSKADGQVIHRLLASDILHFHDKLTPIAVVFDVTLPALFVSYRETLDLGRSVSPKKIAGENLSRHICDLICQPVGHDQVRFGLKGFKVRDYRTSEKVIVL